MHDTIDARHDRSDILSPPLDTLYVQPGILVGDDNMTDVGAPTLAFGLDMQGGAGDAHLPSCHVLR